MAGPKSHQPGVRSKMGAQSSGVVDVPMFEAPSVAAKPMSTKRCRNSPTSAEHSADAGPVSKQHWPMSTKSFTGVRQACPGSAKFGSMSHQSWPTSTKVARRVRQEVWLAGAHKRRCRCRPTSGTLFGQMCAAHLARLKRSSRRIGPSSCGKARVAPQRQRHRVPKAPDLTEALRAVLELRYVGQQAFRNHDRYEAIAGPVSRSLCDNMVRCGRTRAMFGRIRSYVAHSAACLAKSGRHRINTASTWALRARIWSAFRRCGSEFGPEADVGGRDPIRQVGTSKIDDLFSPPNPSCERKCSVACSTSGRRRLPEAASFGETSPKR